MQASPYGGRHSGRHHYGTTDHHRRPGPRTNCSREAGPASKSPNTYNSQPTVFVNRKKEKLFHVGGTHSVRPR